MSVPSNVVWSRLPDSSAVKVLRKTREDWGESEGAILGVLFLLVQFYFHFVASYYLRAWHRL